MLIEEIKIGQQSPLAQATVGTSVSIAISAS